MKHKRLTTSFIIRLNILILIGIVVCIGSISVIAAEFDDEESMMHKLFEFHSKLASQGNLESITRLGVMYERGEGVAKNRKKAIDLYQFAADRGYSPAIEYLANISSNKANGSNQVNTLDTIKVPIPKKNEESDEEKIVEQKELEARLKQEQAAAEAVRKQLDNLRQSKQEEEEKQKRLQEEIQKVRNTQEQLAKERAKAEAARQEIELIKKKREEELKQQKELAKKLQEQKQLQEQSEAKLNDADKAKFSSNPCNTPAAKFMSTCN